jgi:hypothetical protein
VSFAPRESSIIIIIIGSYHHQEPVSTDSIVTGYGVCNQGSIPDKENTSSLPHSNQTGFGTHPASSPMGTSTVFLGVK